MSAPHENDPLEQARDRLTDRVLTEALGGERPPDLSQKILDQAEEQKVSVAQPTSPTGRSLTGRHLAVIAAATMTSAAVLFLAATPMTVETALRDEKPPRGETVVRGPSIEPSAEIDSGFNSVVSDEAALLEETRSEPIALAVDGAAPSPSDQMMRRARELSEFETRNNQIVANPNSPALSVEAETQPKRSATSSTFGFAQQSAPTAASPTPSPYYVTDDVEYFAAPTAAGRAPGLKPARPQFGYGRDRVRLWPEPSSGDRYATIHENAFITPTGESALSTFSVDVDKASYSNVRQYLLDSRRLPPPAAVRVEELVNYFEYSYAGPTADSEDPFAASMEVAACPWAPSHRLVRIGVKGRTVDADKRPLSNLVFLIDVSGSMNDRNKLPLVVEGLRALTDRLGENDRVAIVVYAGSEGVVLPSTSGDHKDEIRSALGRLQAGGSTAGGAGLKLAYELAERHKIPGGVNRVVLCTDGDFNVGLTGTDELAKLVETRAKETGVFLTVLGFGRGNLNDAMLETISGRGDGHYAYIDNEKEARRVLSRDLSGTLVTIAKDVKLQVEFNPAQVASYRLIGYENRVMAAEDFNDDTKDAGEIGAGHTVTALYEIVPVGVEQPTPPVDGLKYQATDGGAATEERTADSQQPTASSELLTLKIRYKQPEGGASKKLEFPLEDTDADLAKASEDFRWAATVAEFGLLLRGSSHAGDGSYEAVLELARGALGDDPHGYRAEFIEMVRRAQELSGR